MQESPDNIAISPRVRAAKAPFEWIGEQTIRVVEDIGQVSIMAGQTAAWLFRLYRVRVFVQALDSVGVGSLFIVVFTGLFTGLVLAYQSIIAFGMFERKPWLEEVHCRRVLCPRARTCSDWSDGRRPHRQRNDHGNRDDARD
ncbi:MAG: ABC transporter permease [bacterium]